MTVMVVGSLNRDVILRVSAPPRAGQTIPAQSQRQAHGGKGMNQAIAAALAGAPCAMIGAVGDDEAGAALLSFASARGVDTSGVLRLPGPTGTAYVLVGDDGDNGIVILAGANGAVTADLVEPALSRLGPADVLVAQGEIPPATTDRCAALAVTAGTRVVVNAAPVVPLAPATLAVADPLVVNEFEAVELLGGSGAAAPDPVAAARTLAGSCRSVVLTQGARGCLVAVADTCQRVQATPVDRVVDTTGAGDAFVGVLASGLHRGLDLVEAARRASRAAALSITRPGAADSYTSAFAEGR